MLHTITLDNLHYEEVIDTRDLIDMLSDDYGVDDWENLPFYLLPVDVSHIPGADGGWTFTIITDEEWEEEWTVNDDSIADIIRIVDILAEVEDYSGDRASDGVALIRGTYVQEYAQQFAEDCGMIPEDAGWPTYNIDWEAATRDFLMDYTEIEIDGTTYHLR